MTLGPGVARTPLPTGFYASGINCGVRRYRPDLGLIVSDFPAAAAGVYTLNSYPAAPILYCRALTPSEGIRAIITNSGQANAATGPEGIAANKKMVDAVSAALNCPTNSVLSASTGAIGPQLDLEKILPAVPQLVERLTDTAENFALAILTTDLVPKTFSMEVELSGGTARITGICKGSGMIHPNMATMLGYVLTDLELDSQSASRLLKSAVDKSFNMISVDGDSSTNDAVFLLANGASKVRPSHEADWSLLASAIDRICISMAKSIAMDGEGATKLIEVRVSGAPDAELARRVARSITISPLIKTAVHGEDPNWGRIMARIGSENVGESSLEKLEVRLQNHLLLLNGVPQTFKREEVKASLKKSLVEVEINFKNGPHTATAWGCDLSEKYVHINTEYN